MESLKPPWFAKPDRVRQTNEGFENSLSSQWSIFPIRDCHSFMPATLTAPVADSVVSSQPGNEAEETLLLSNPSPVEVIGSANVPVSVSAGVLDATEPAPAFTFPQVPTVSPTLVDDDDDDDDVDDSDDDDGDGDDSPGIGDDLDDIDDDVDEFDDIDEDDFDDDFDDDFEEELDDDYEIEIDDEISAEFGLNTAGDDDDEDLDDDLDDFDDFESID